MKIIRLSCVAAITAAAFAGSAPANAGYDIADVVTARANARAGGPISDRQGEILQRFGALRGTTAYYEWRARKKKKSYSHRRRHHRGY